MKHPTKVMIFAMLAALGAGGLFWYFSTESASQTAHRRASTAASPAPVDIPATVFLKQPLPAKPPALEPPGKVGTKDGVTNNLVSSILWSSGKRFIKKYADLSFTNITALTESIPSEMMAPVFVPAITVPDTDFDVISKGFFVRNAVNSAVKNYLPVTLNLVQPIYSGAWKEFRPVFTAGVGVLGQTTEAPSLPSESEFEMRMMFRAGLNMEWTPATEWIIRFGYEYFRLARPFATSPDLPQQNHGITFGMEHRF